MLTWLGVCAGAAGVAFGSALIPLISVELFVVAMMANHPHVNFLLVGAAVAIGQIAGKLFYYLAARGSIRLPDFMHRKLHSDKPPSARRERWHQRTKRVRVWFEGLKEKCHQHPHWMLSTYGISAVVGLPPFMATAVLAGLVRMSLTAFLSAGLIGRFIRFSILAASPTLLSGWLF